jgi:hypothetical protein
LKLNKFWISVALVLGLPLRQAVGQAGIGADSTVARPPEHPATEATLQRYFEVCHFVAHNREGMEKQFEMQQKQLPPWYPADVWNETVSAVLDLDAVAIAIPVYQKYYSEEGTQNAIYLFLTPDGQAMLKKVYGETIQEEAAGDSAVEARRKALVDERAHEDSDIRKMLQSMTPQEQRAVTAFVHSAEWKRMNDLSPQLYQEFNTVYVAEQQAVVHEISTKHRDELMKALRDYKAAHPGYEQEKPAASN